MEPTTPEFKPLNAKQFKMLHSTWKLAQAQPLDTGMTIFFEFFKKYPNFFAFFKNFYNIPFDELKEMAHFRTMVSKLMNTYDCAIDAMDREYGYKEVGLIFTEMAEFHMKYKYFNKQGLVAFKETFIGMLTTMYKMDKDMVLAWNYFFDMVYYVMFTIMDGGSINF